MADFQKEIEKAKNDLSFRTRNKIGEGASRITFKTDCGRYVIKHDLKKISNKSEAQIWKKTKSFMLNPVVWHSQNYEWIVQPFCEVSKPSLKEAAQTESEISKYIGLGFMNINQIGYWFEYIYPDIMNEINLNPRLKELHRVWKIANRLCFDDWMYDLHFANWGKDILGRYVIIDYGHFEEL